MIVYLNIKTSEGVETIDELRTSSFETLQDFRTEKKRLLNEYRLSSNYYSGIYTSQRSTNDWKQK